MPTPLITPPAEFDFLESAERVHRVANYDFSTILDHYFTKQYVFKTPTYFMLAGEDPQRQDAWLVWWCELHPDIARHLRTRTVMRTLLHCVPYHRPWIGWARPLKGRVDVKYYSTERLLRFMQNRAA